MSDTDLQLLARYAEERTETAFAELVKRHLPLVYSAALRQVRSPQLAEEVAQTVFLELAKNARRFKPGTILTAWLYAVARRTAIDVVRRESRRQLREQAALEIADMKSPSLEWEQLEPLLDEAMDKLDDTDRAAVLLRYFENKSLREIGAALGTSDDAAQKRVSRAVDQLRELFSKRGVTLSAGTLAVILSAHAVQAAPTALAGAISTAVLAATSAAATAAFTHTTITTMSLIKTTTAIVATAVLAGTGTFLFHKRDFIRLRQENQNLLSQQAGLIGERDAAVAAVEANRVELERARRERDDLLRLRGEVSRLRNQTNDLAKAQAENRQLRATLESAKPKPSPPVGADPSYVPKEQWSFAGYAEPESAVRSIHWAMSNGDVKSLLASVAPSIREKMEESWAGKSESEISAGLMNDNDVSKVLGYRIVSQEMISDNRVVVTMYQKGRNREKKMCLERVGHEWKMSSLTQ